MTHERTKDLPARAAAVSAGTEETSASVFFLEGRPDVNKPAVIHSSAMPLFRLETRPEKYAHLLKKKDLRQISPIVDYLISNSGHVAFLAGDVVRNLYLNGRRKYRTITVLAILTGRDVDKYSGIMNNIISSNDGAFSLKLKYRVRKNRSEGCFRDIAHERYLIEPRLEGPEKLLYPFRPAAIELDLTTRARFSRAFGVEVR